MVRTNLTRHQPSVIFGLSRLDISRLASFPSPNPKEGAGNVYLTFNGGVDKKVIAAPAFPARNRCF